MKNMTKNQHDFGVEALKSPFFKGGFRGIMERLSNPPYPPLEKGGNPRAFTWNSHYEALHKGASVCCIFPLSPIGGEG